MRRKTELVKGCFAVFMVALIQLLSQSYEETHAGCAPLHMLRLYMLHPRDWVSDGKLDSAETLQVRGGKCVGAVGMASSSSSRLLGVVPRGKHGGDCTIGVP